MKLTNGIYFEQFGEKKNSPLVFIHPAAVDSNIWREFAIYLSKSFFVVTYDLRNHGLSDHKKKTDINTHVSDLNFLIKELNLSNPILCGLSMGGLIAQSYSEKYPIKAMLLIGSPTYSIMPNLKIIKGISKFFICLFVRIAWPQSINIIIKTMFKSLDVNLKKYLLNIAIKNGLNSFLEDIAIIIDFKEIKINSDTKVFYFVGEFDEKRVHKHAIYLNKKIGCDIIKIDKAFHVPHLENEILFKSKFAEIIGNCV